MLDQRLEADTIPVCLTPASHVRLMNDDRWPWLILIPTQGDIRELHELSDAERNLFMADVNIASRIMKTTTACQSVNVAMLGNVVSQLHCHVVARNPDDANWPAPVWGYGESKPYSEPQSQAAKLIKAITKALV